MQVIVLRKYFNIHTTSVNLNIRIIRILYFTMYLINNTFKIHIYVYFIKSVILHHNYSCQKCTPISYQHCIKCDVCQLYNLFSLISKYSSLGHSS